MPKIPTDTASLDYRPSRGDVAAAGASGLALAKFGETALQVAGDYAERANQAEKARQKAITEADRANGTSQAMAALHQTIEAFEADTDPNTIMDRWMERVDTAGQDIFAGIRDSGARAQVEADYGNLARVQAALLQGDSLRRLSERGRRDLDRNLGLYADVAAGARHPLEHDDAVRLALREIQGKADAGFIARDDAGRIEQGFHGDLAGRQARRAIAADPQSALDSLKGGEDFAALDPAARARLTGEAERAVQAQAVRLQTEQAAVRRDIQVRLPGYLEALRDGEPPDDPRFGRAALAATLGAAEGDKRWAEIEQAKDFGRAMAQVKWATPDEISDLVDYGDRSFVLEKLPFVLGSLDGLQKENLIQRVVDRRNEQLWSKPADYVLNNPRVAELHAAMAQATAPPQPSDAAAALQGMLPATTGQPAAPQSMLSPEDRRAAIAAYANGTLAEQERLGVPEDRRQVLPENMAKEIATGILGGDPAKADQTLRDLAADWGDAWPRVVNELKDAGLPPAYAELAARHDPVSRQTLAKVLATQTNEPGALRARTGADADGIDDLVYRHRAGPDGQFLSDDRIKLVKLLAYYYARFSEPEAAVRRAFADFTGDVVLTVGSAGKSEADDIADVWRDKGARQRDRWRGNVKVLPPRKPLKMYDSDGNPVMSVDRWGNSVQVEAPEGVNFHVFGEIGEKDRNAGDPAIFERLTNFVHGGPWDLQRPVTETRNGMPRKNTYDDKFVNAASVAIGIYAAAAGWSLDDILRWTNRFAAVKSNFGNVKFSQTYKSLPERNVLNTTLGYNMQKDGKIPNPE